MKYFAFSLFASAFITFLIVRSRHLHFRLSADHDLSGIQKCHAVPVPRIGGIGIFTSLLLLLLSLILSKSPYARFISLFLIPAALVFAIGLIEDLTKRVSVSVRLSVTMLAALLGCFLTDCTIRTFSIPVLDTLFQINLVALVFTAIAVAGVANSVNLIDGLNGLSGGVSLTALLALGFVSYQVGDNLLTLLSLGTAGAVSGFLVWNYPRAKIFMGDGGAYLVGFVIAEISIQLFQHHRSVSVFVPFLVMLYPVFETLFTMYRRKFIRGVSPGAPDSIHMHQVIHKRLVRWRVRNSSAPLRTRGNSTTSPYLWILNLTAVIPAILFWDSPSVLVGFILFFMCAYIWLYSRIVTFRTPHWLRRRRHTHGRNTIAITANTAWYVFNFRSGLIRTLQERGYRVMVFAQRDEYVPRLLDLGCHFCELEMRSASTNPIRDIATILRYSRLLGEHRPAVLLTFTPKANIYGSIAARWQAIPVIVNVSGLGSAFINQNWVTKVARLLYSFSLKYPQKVFFQNEDDQSIFLNLDFVRPNQVGLLPGSGVNVVRFSPVQSSRPERPFTFMLVARMLRDKGVVEFIDAARIIKATQPDVKFQLVGFLGTDNPSAISEAEMDVWVKEGIVEYLGPTDNVPARLANTDCVVLPSYREGTPRTLLEAASMALPIITTNAPGCRNTVDDGISGYLCEVKDVEGLADCMRRILALSNEERHKMGAAGRNKMKRQFNEQIVFDAYLNAVDMVSHTGQSRIIQTYRPSRVGTTA